MRFRDSETLELNYFLVYDPNLKVIYGTVFEHWEFIRVDLCISVQKFATRMS